MYEGRLKSCFFLVLLLILVSFVALLTSNGITLADEEYDIELQDVMEGNVPGLSVEVRGAGGYYGSCIQAEFANWTTQTLKIKVPIGLRLIPRDAGVQTMYTAGGEIITVPPAFTTNTFKAFCGEMHDAAPGTSDIFDAGGRADGDLMRTLERINDQERYDETGQEAVWHYTDDLDVSYDEEAVELISADDDTVSPEEAAAAGGAAIGIAGTAAVLHMRRKGNGGSVLTDNNVSEEENPPEKDTNTGKTEEAESHVQETEEDIAKTDNPPDQEGKKELSKDKVVPPPIEVQGASEKKPEQQAVTPPASTPVVPATNDLPGWKKDNSLLARDPDALFTKDNLLRYRNVQVTGANSLDLRVAMYDLANNPWGHRLDDVLEQIARARGKPVSEIRQDYEKFLKLQKQRDSINPGEYTELSKSAHYEFMGSTSQLRYGKIIGEAFGIDPVFGALLNPTGGMVGPGNVSFDGGNTAVGIHGAVHDAAGYLYNNHKAGPGYDYLGLEHRDTSSPLSGQTAGIRFWREQTNEGIGSLSGVSEIVVTDFVMNVDVINVLREYYILP